jgi:hypothetical protein
MKHGKAQLWVIVIAIKMTKESSVITSMMQSESSDGQ